MHPVATMKHWSQHLHDGMLRTRHHIDQHLHSSHFWAGVGIALLAVVFVTLIALLSMKAPTESFKIYPYSSPYVPYR